MQHPVVAGKATMDSLSRVPRLFPGRELWDVDHPVIQVTNLEKVAQGAQNQIYQSMQENKPLQHYQKNFHGDSWGGE